MNKITDVLISMLNTIPFELLPYVYFQLRDSAQDMVMKEYNDKPDDRFGDNLLVFLSNISGK